MDDAAVIGAGPVGLSLAIFLALRGQRVRVFEQRSTPSTHSRAIGLHPPAQQILASLGIGEQLQALGVPIRRGLGISRGKLIGAMDFSVLGGEYPQILSLPQAQTESLLRARLRQLAPGALETGCAFESVSALSGRHVEFSAGGSKHGARWLVGADGVHSQVRAQLGIGFHGKAHPDRYSMGDFPDTTGLRHTAALFLHSEGIVESFPLPGGLRRWVVRTDPAGCGGTSAGLARQVARRTGFIVDPERCSMHSNFTTATRFASSMAQGRVVLLGDAAHQISPIGGQGLCLGLADAQALSQAMEQGSGLEELSLFRLAAARAAARRARINMFLGRPAPCWSLPLRDAMFRLAASSERVHLAVAKSFTMSP
ncbi:oxidoreductase [Glutamicibacter uratoxydans]|uniref:Oxidoreductase n=1 Tax=Glutamicibacter uratoxydans TaxID=43667 RepID=A0A4Y4DNM4_GLUUR|nr:NAD(P)/FAD-dependent oxidoreductase [Glutamicibacter uratoxydans]GED04938.1 oxidoreductase [Glutamicibacter uratoxydans]